MFGFKTKATKLTEEIVRVATNDATDWARDYPGQRCPRDEAWHMYMHGSLSTEHGVFARYYDVLCRRIDSINHG